MRVLPLIALLGATSAVASDYSSPYGEWRGQTQYQAFIRTTPDPTAHAVISLTVAIDRGGKLIGTSTENGCRFLGLAAPGSFPNIVTIDVTLSGCQYAAFNRTYKGHLALYSKERYAKLSLQALDTSSRKAGTYNITSTMRR
jgi:hypothetical protein